MNPLLRAAIALGAGALASRAIPQSADNAASDKLRVGLAIAVGIAAWLAAPAVVSGKPLT